MICHEEISQLKPELDEIDSRILAYLTKADWPVTSEMVANEVKVNWNTAQLHLYKLMAHGLVKGKEGGPTEPVDGRRKRKGFKMRLRTLTAWVR